MKNPDGDERGGIDSTRIALIFLAVLLARFPCAAPAVYVAGEGMVVGPAEKSRLSLL